jgi:hypothetical protein
MKKFTHVQLKEGGVLRYKNQRMKFGKYIKTDDKDLIGFLLKHSNFIEVGKNKKEEPKKEEPKKEEPKKEEPKKSDIKNK